jgi:hypothetical protein
MTRSDHGILLETLESGRTVPLDRARRGTAVLSLLTGTAPLYAPLMIGQALAADVHLVVHRAIDQASTTDGFSWLEHCYTGIEREPAVASLRRRHK